MRTINFYNYVIYEDGRVFKNGVEYHYQKLKTKPTLYGEKDRVLDKLIYEKFNNVKLDASKKIEHLDGNIKNCALSNLKVVNRKKARRIIDTKTGKIYESCADFARQNYTSRCNVSAYLRGEHKTGICEGLEYYD